MNQEYFKKMTDMAKKVQEPLQAMMELNMKTLQSFQYMKPSDFTTLKKPEEFIEKQMELAMANSQKAVDYLQKSYQIMEKTMTTLTQETKSKKEGKE